MGQLTLLFVLAAFLISGIVVYNAGNSADRAEERVWQHQARVLAKDAAATGMAVTLRKMGSVTFSGFSTHPNYPFQATDVPHNGGTYSVETQNGCSILSSNAELLVVQDFGTVEEWTEVRSTGRYSMGADQHRHEIRSCFARTDWGLFVPPAFNYAFISDNNLSLNANINVEGLVDGEVAGTGHIHTNGLMTLGPNVTVSGHGTYTDDGSSRHTSGGSATQIQSFESGPSVTMEPFPIDPLRPTDSGQSEANGFFRYDAGNVTIGGNTTLVIPHPDHQVVLPEGQSYVWFVEGDLTISANVILPQHTIVVVNGKLDIQGNASISRTGPPMAGQTNLEWVNSQLVDGEVPIAMYVDGDGLGDDPKWDVEISGAANVVGNIYTNGSFRLGGGGNASGGGNLVGSVAALGDIVGLGGGTGSNFYFAGVSQQNVIPGVMLPGKRIVRVATAEWTEPVLANSN
jgi:hypothetical protein